MTRLLPKFMGWTQEVPSGTVNGSNVTFTLAFTPYDASTLELYVNGIAQRLTTDYTISGATITFVSAPATSSDIYARYRKV